MVTGDHEERDTGSDEAVDTPGELALLGLTGFAAFIGVPAEYHYVRFSINSVVHHLVERRKEVHEA